MGSATAFLSICAVILVISSTAYGSSGRCPPPSKVYGCTPVCRDDHDCKGGKVCCPNSCNTKSCSEPASGGQGATDKYQSGGPGVYCGNAKCSPFEKCVKDPRTGKLVCQRA